MADASEFTNLFFDEIEIPPYSARGIRETFEPDYEPDLARTVNGALIDLTPEQDRKVRIRIQCDDMDAPALQGIWPGMEITVNCTTELSYASTDGPEHSVVPGSERTGDGFVFYRPRFSTRVASFSIDTDEAGAAVGWTLVLREI